MDDQCSMTSAQMMVAVAVGKTYYGGVPPKIAKLVYNSNNYGFWYL